MWPEQGAAELDEHPSDSVAILQKPFMPAALLETIHRLIGWSIERAPALRLKAAS
jgi:hypothetical protein